MVTQPPHTDNDSRPQALPVQPAGIPAELRALDRWVLWRYEHRKGKWTKPPYSVSGLPASSTDPATWSPFDAALAAYRRGGWDGIGLIHLPEDNLTGIDVDKCRDAATGTLTARAERIVAELSTYAERSPSGTGIRAYARGHKPDRKRSKNGPVEMYDGLTKKGLPGGRFLTLTGHHLPGTPATIEARQDVIETVYRRELVGEAKPGPNGAASHGAPLDDEAILRLLRRERGGKAGRLLDGDTTGYPSPSEADAALAAKIAYYTRDRDQIRRLLLGSGLARDKHQRADYVERTISGALELVTDHYEPAVPMGTIRRNGRGGTNSTPPVAGDGSEGDKTPAAVILAWLSEKLAPLFRRGAKVYSDNLRREVGRSEISPDSDIIRRLADSYCPLDRKGKPDPDLLPKVYRDWFGVAWGDLMASLEEEGDNGEVGGNAAEEFKGRIAAALLSPHSMKSGYDRDGQRVEITQLPLVEWCRRFAKPGGWQDVHRLQIWCRKDGTRTCVALRPGLFGQLRPVQSDLAKLTPTAFTRLAHHYGVGRAIRWGHGGQFKAVEVAPDLIDELLAGPEGATSPLAGLAREANEVAPSTNGG